MVNGRRYLAVEEIEAGDVLRPNRPDTEPEHREHMTWFMAADPEKHNSGYWFLLTDEGGRFLEPGDELELVSRLEERCDVARVGVTC
ncbi:hypothetical protein AB0F93_00375 [Micromonospora tulbaghiae]|uniref:hypothetical protein n=1 Tax=Micromonospora tulbaghiae TaxID=479978 RepID=UPI00332FF97D